MQKFPCVLRNVLIIISNTTGLSFVLKRIGPLAATIVAIFYLLVLYLLVISKTHKYFPFSSCSATLLKSTCQHFLLLVGFDTLTYRTTIDPYTCGSSCCLVISVTCSRKQYKGTTVSTSRVMCIETSMNITRSKRTTLVHGKVKCARLC